MSSSLMPRFAEWVDGGRELHFYLQISAVVSLNVLAGSGYGIKLPPNMSSLIAPGLRESVQEKWKPPSASAAIPW